MKNGHRWLADLGFIPSIIPPCSKFTAGGFGLKVVLFLLVLFTPVKSVCAKPRMLPSVPFLRVHGWQRRLVRLKSTGSKPIDLHQFRSRNRAGFGRWQSGCEHCSE